MKEITWSNSSEKKSFNKYLKVGLFITGALFSTLLSAQLLPVMISSGVFSNTQSAWYLSRASGVIAFIFLWLSMVMGLLMTTRLIPRGRGTGIAAQLHSFVSWYGLLFSVVHGVSLLWDSYIGLNVFQLLMPFTVVNYEPLMTGFGQIGLYLWFLLAVSSLVRKSIGRSAWRWLHYLSFTAFWLVLLHGISAGSDSSTPGMQALYWASGASMVFLSTYRVLDSVISKSSKEKEKNLSGTP